ncbi:MAG: outer membrane protein assembly factor BamD [Prolixibacteraceae bacterium]|nr:outer membrane protein assembly factor BamD [Prolixibacteraceae bacterium]
MEKRWFFLLIFSLFLFSCSEFNTVVKSTDYEYKYKKALEYYNSGDYVHATSLFEDLVYAFRGTSKGADLYYFYAQSCFKQKDYLLAGHYYKSLYEQYPRHEHAEEAHFMVGMCYYMDSPNPKLDQEITRKAIDAFQLFINLYPYSEKVEEANILIDELNEKIVYKSYLSAKLYYDMEYYKAAVIALDNSLSDYPATKHREELKFLLFKAKFYLAIKSIEQLKRERLNAARDEYFIFVDEFPLSKHVKEVTRNFKQISELLGYGIEEEITSNN